MKDYPFYLASASPRRLELLRQLGLDPTVRVQQIDERGAIEAPATTSVDDLVLRLARAKAQAAANAMCVSDAPGVILGADTLVVVDGSPLGKPADAEEAQTMLQRLRGREHSVLTGVWLIRSNDGKATGGVEETRVTFRDYDQRLLEAYVASGEPLDKAGAYAIQGRGALLCSGIEGSWSNVVGLPVERLPGWLFEIGFDIAEMIHWRTGDGQEPVSF